MPVDPISRIHAARAGVPVGPAEGMTDAMWRARSQHSRWPLVSEDDILELTPGHRARYIAGMRAQLLGDLLTLLRPTHRHGQ